MSEPQSTPFSVASLFAEREAKQLADKQAEEQLSRRHEEELAEFRKRLEKFELTPDIIEATKQRIRRAFERGETEIMYSSFPCELCTDQGRAINNADLPPLVKLTPEEAERLRHAPPAWLETVPAGIRMAYDYWKTHMQPNGFKFSVRIIDYPAGKPGNVGLFISWPKNLAEHES